MLFLNGSFNSFKTLLTSRMLLGETISPVEFTLMGLVCGTSKVARIRWDYGDHKEDYGDHKEDYGDHKQLADLPFPPQHFRLFYGFLALNEGTVAHFVQTKAPQTYET
uniref:Uncharacterized protein n=1 Tax=Glossina austeni TaxID=7395 RepID=A0A1A9VDJ6_GLOAU